MRVTLVDGRQMVGQVRVSLFALRFIRDALADMER